MIASERVEGDPESGLFGLVDELTSRIRKQLETPSLVRFAEKADKKEKKLQEVTTASVEAYKAYAEGSRLHERMQEREAKAYFEKAVEADPGFAMALAKLSVVSANLGDVDKAREYSKQAIARSESLPAGERYYIEGRHYSLDPSSTEQAVAAYQKAVDAAPDHTAARNNLAAALIGLRRYPEALVHLEELRRRGMSFPGSYLSLAETYLATGQPEKAREALTSYVIAHPDSSVGLENLGFFELTEGQTDAALAAFDKAAALRPSEMMKIEMGRATAHVLRDEWPEAEGCAKRLMDSSDPRERWEGGATLAIASLYRGDVGEARRLAAEGVKAGGTVSERVGARLFRARLESDLGRHGVALGEAERAIAEPGAEARAARRGARHEGALPDSARARQERGSREEPQAGRRVPQDDSPRDGRAAAAAARGRAGAGPWRPRAGPRGAREGRGAPPGEGRFDGLRSRWRSSSRSRAPRSPRDGRRTRVGRSRPWSRPGRAASSRRSPTCAAWPCSLPSRRSRDARARRAVSTSAT